MKNILPKACASLWICVLALPIQALGQQLWDGEAGDLEWTNGLNWTCSLGGECDDRVPDLGDSAANFAAASPTNQTTIYISADTTVTRIQLRNNCPAPQFRTIQIGTNALADVTLGLSGTYVSLLANQKAAAGWDFNFSGAPNDSGAKLKMRIDLTGPISVSDAGSSITLSCDISGAGGFDKTGPGKLTLSGNNTYLGGTTVTAGTLLVNSPGSISAASAVTVNSGGILGGNGTINGAVTVNAGGALAPGASVGTLAIGGGLTLAGDLLIEVDKSLSPSNDVINVTGTLTNAGSGTMTVSRIGGPALLVGDNFPIFNRAVPGAETITVVAGVGGGVGAVWTNKLWVDGSVEVLVAPEPDVPATNVTIQAVGPTSFSLGGTGATNTPYSVYASPNVTSPMPNWTRIGKTNSDAGGVIQFLDSPATGDQRFYRFGQP